MSQMWNKEYYTPAARMRDGRLQFNECELTEDKCVYLIDFGNNNLYVGSTSDIKNRTYSHARRLIDGNHTKYIMDAYNPSKGFDVFVLLRLDNVAENLLRKSEMSMIDLLRPNLNHCKMSCSSLTRSEKWTPERILKVNGKYNHTSDEQLIGFINFRGGSRICGTIKQVMSVLNEIDEQKFNYICWMHTYNYIKRKYLKNPHVQYLLELLYIEMDKEFNTQNR